MIRKVYWKLIAIVVISITGIATYILYSHNSSHLNNIGLKIQFIVFTFGEILITLFSITFLHRGVRELYDAKRKDQQIAWYQIPSLTLCLAGLFPGVFLLWGNLDGFLFLLLHDDLLALILSFVVYGITSMCSILLLIITGIGIDRKRKISKGDVSSESSSK